MLTNCTRTMGYSSLVPISGMTLILDGEGKTPASAGSRLAQLKGCSAERPDVGPEKKTE